MLMLMLLPCLLTWRHDDEFDAIPLLPRVRMRAAAPLCTYFLALLCPYSALAAGCLAAWPQRSRSSLLYEHTGDCNDCCIRCCRCVHDLYPYTLRSRLLLRGATRNSHEKNTHTHVACVHL
jgi:hypothetical protein